MRLLRKDNKDFHFVGHPLLEEKDASIWAATSEDRAALLQMLKDKQIRVVKGV